MPPAWSPQGSPASLPGFRVGHALCPGGRSGATAVLCPPATVGGVAVRGSAAGSRQMDGLAPEHMVNEVHAVLFTGGSSFGLDAGGGAQAYLAERGVGFKAGDHTVPVVPTAVIFDLPLNPDGQRPDRETGRAACAAASAGPMERGNAGAGAGATVGKLYGPAQAMKGGLGGAAFSLGDLQMGALAVVNAFGDVVAGDGRPVAGARAGADSLELIDTAAWFMAGNRRQAFLPPSNTTLGVVATNARLDKLMACKLAALAHHGLVHSVRPVHSVFDGDLVVVLASGQVEADLTGLGLMAAECLRRAVLDAVWAAEALPGLPCARDLPGARDPRPPL
ncbi:MAG: P1 family peptidase [Thermodesulfobacteriota bacterium]